MLPFTSFLKKKSFYRSFNFTDGIIMLYTYIDLYLSASNFILLFVIYIYTSISFRFISITDKYNVGCNLFVDYKRVGTPARDLFYHCNCSVGLKDQLCEMNIGFSTLLHGFVTPADFPQPAMVEQAGLKTVYRKRPHKSSSTFQVPTEEETDSMFKWRKILKDLLLESTAGTTSSTTDLELGIAATVSTSSLALQLGGALGAGAAAAVPGHGTHADSRSDDTIDGSDDIDGSDLVNGTGGTLVNYIPY